MYNVSAAPSCVNGDMRGNNGRGGNYEEARGPHHENGKLYSPSPVIFSLLFL